MTLGRRGRQRPYHHLEAPEHANLCDTEEVVRGGRDSESPNFSTDQSEKPGASGKTWMVNTKEYSPYAFMKKQGAGTSRTFKAVRREYLRALENISTTTPEAVRMLEDPGLDTQINRAISSLQKELKSQKIVTNNRIVARDVTNSKIANSKVSTAHNTTMNKRGAEFLTSDEPRKQRKVDVPNEGQEEMLTFIKNYIPKPRKDHRGRRVTFHPMVQKAIVDILTVLLLLHTREWCQAHADSIQSN